MRSLQQDKRPGKPDTESGGSAFDRLVAWIDRQPLPAWLFYALVTGATVVVGGTLLRLSGSPAKPEFAMINLLSQLLTVYPLAMMHYLKNTAGGSLQMFRPALGKLQAEYPRLEASLTRMSGRSLWVATVLGVLFTALSVAQTPDSWGLAEAGPLGAAVFGLLQGTWVDIGIMALFLFLIQQIRCIARIHREATNISLYERSSHHAFSRLTLVAAVGLLVPVYGYALLVRSTATDAPRALSEVDSLMVLVFVLLSAVVFVVPIYGMRRRLQALKKAALRKCDQRFESVVKRLHPRLDAGNLKDLAGLNHAMSSLSLEREALHRISTWPWAADTLRRYLSSVALPVFVFLLGRYIGRFFGL